MTPAGTADGFTLSTFATTNPGYTGCCNGPFGVAVLATGNILVNTGGGQRYVFADADGQTPGSALYTQSSGGAEVGYPTAGGEAYGGIGSNSGGLFFGSYGEFNSDGTVNHLLTDVSATPYLGMAGDPVNGHLIANSYSGLINIDPLANGGAGSFSVITTSVNPSNSDGVGVSPNGTVAYVEVTGEINGYNIASGAQAFSSGAFSGLTGPDGTAVISSSNSLNGDLIVNFNGNGSTTGGVGLLDPTTDAFTIIASGGTRGDYVSPDTNNGTLFLDYSDTVERLSCGSACAIGSALPHMGVTPEPASLVLLGSGLAGLAGWRQWRRMKQA